MALARHLRAVVGQTGFPEGVLAEQSLHLFGLRVDLGTQGRDLRVHEAAFARQAALLECHFLPPCLFRFS